MKFRVWHITRVCKRIFLISPALFSIFYFLNSRAPPQIETVEEDYNFQQAPDQNLLVYNLSETREFLKNSTTSLVYPINPPAGEDVDSKSVVPRILHFIWIGRNMKENYLENIITWREKNPKYEVIFWTDHVNTASRATLEKARITMRDLARYLKERRKHLPGSHITYLQ